MITRDTQIRVRYGEVDRMGFLYHEHYVAYFDVARTEFIRSLGISNLEIEEEGIMLPVLNVTVDYKNPAYYDDVLTIRTTLKEMPSAKITFYFEVFRQTGELITTGRVTLAFTNSVTKRAARPPKKLLDIVAEYM